LGALAELFLADGVAGFASRVAGFGGAAFGGAGFDSLFVSSQVATPPCPEHAPRADLAEL